MKYVVTQSGEVINKTLNRKEWFYIDDLVELLAMWRTGKFYLREIGEWFGVSQEMVRRVIRKDKDKEYEEILSKVTRRGEYQWEIDPLGYDK